MDMDCQKFKDIMDKEDAEVPQRTQRLILAPPLRALRPNLILLYLVFALISCSQETGRLDQIDKIFSTAAKEDKFNGNVLIAEKGEIIYKKSYGKSDWATPGNIFAGYHHKKVFPSPPIS